MNNISETKRTPSVTFDNNSITIKGKSIPEHAVDFYNPIKTDIIEFVSSKKSVELNFQFIYFNTSSYKSILEIIKTSQELSNELTINWYYEPEDEDMQDSGQDIKELLSTVNVNIIEQDIE